NRYSTADQPPTMRGQMMSSFAEMSFHDVAAYSHTEVTPAKLNTINGEQMVKLVEKLRETGQVLDYYFWFLVDQASMDSMESKRRAGQPVRRRRELIHPS